MNGLANMTGLSVHLVRLLVSSAVSCSGVVHIKLSFFNVVLLAVVFLCSSAVKTQAQGAAQAQGAVLSQGAVQAQAAAYPNVFNSGELSTGSVARSNPDRSNPDRSNLDRSSTDRINIDRGRVQGGVEASGVRLASSTPVELRKPSRPIGELQSAQSGTRGSSGGLVSTLFSLGLVLGLFLATAAIAHRYMKPPVKQQLPSSVMEVLGSISLPTQPRQQAILMRLGQRVLLLSSHAGQTCTLAEFTDPDEVALLIAQCRTDVDHLKKNHEHVQSKKKAGSGFRDLLSFQ